MPVLLTEMAEYIASVEVRGVDARARVCILLTSGTHTPRAWWERQHVDHRGHVRGLLNIMSVHTGVALYTCQHTPTSNILL